VPGLLLERPLGEVSAVLCSSLNPPFAPDPNTSPPLNSPLVATAGRPWHGLEFEFVKLHSAQCWFDL
jgi:hypothetical protein